MKDGKIGATCLNTSAPRVFLAESILAWQASDKGAIT